MSDRPMDKLRASTDVQMVVGPVPGHRIDVSLVNDLAAMLTAEPQVRQAYLVTLRFENDSNLASAGDESLAVVLDLQDDPSRVLFDDLSARSQAVVQGKLGEWRHLDWLSWSPEQVRRIAHIGQRLAPK